jgi:hypothetical protein
MNVDKIIHPSKSFADLSDEDVTAFLRGRSFGSESSILEFKSVFPINDNKSDAREILKLIVGFLNAEGGLVVYGVSDNINEPSVPFPDFVSGLTECPNPEKLSQWVNDCIHPSVYIPPMRVFKIAGREIVILKVPTGNSKPYCYYDPRTHAVWYFVRNGNHTVELAPDEITEFYRTLFANQLDKFLRSSEASGGIRTSRMTTWKNRIKVHQRWVKAKLEDPENFGFMGVYLLPTRPTEIPWENLSKFLEQHRTFFSSELRRSGEADNFQNGVSVGYFPRAIRQDIKSTYRTTLYTDGLVALDSQVDHFMDRGSSAHGKILHPYWLSYELQRHLQLGRAVLEGWDVDRVGLIVEFESINDFSMAFQGDSPYVARSPYSGSHSPIEREIALSEVYAYDGDRRNVAMPVVKDIMEEVCRIFSDAHPPGLWDDSGYLHYVRGSESTR